MDSHTAIAGDTPLLPTPEMAPAMERLLLRLMALLGGMAAIVVLLLLALPQDHMVIEIRITGLAGALLGALLTALAGLAGTLLMAMARLVAQDDAGPARVAWRLRHTAGRPQGIAGAAVALAAIAVLWGLRPFGGPTLPPQGQYLIAGGALLLAFPLLLAERVLAATKAAWLPEAPWLQALLFLALWRRWRSTPCWRCSTASASMAPAAAGRCWVRNCWRWFSGWWRWSLACGRWRSGSCRRPLPSGRAPRRTACWHGSSIRAASSRAVLRRRCERPSASTCRGAGRWLTFAPPCCRCW